MDKARDYNLQAKQYKGVHANKWSIWDKILRIIAFIGVYWRLFGFQVELLDKNFQIKTANDKLIGRNKALIPRNWD
jgi:hypothetical protein